MPNLSLNANDTVSPLGFTTDVSGSTGTETVGIAAGTANVIVDQNIERVDLPGNAADFTFQQAGNALQVYSAGTLMVTIPLQGDADGSQIVFSDGSASATLSTGVMSLGGTVVSSTAGAVVPTLDAATTSLTAGSTSGNTTADSFPLTNGVDKDISANIFNAERVFDPSGDDQMNSLQDDDELIGTGTNPTLNFTFATDTQTFDYDVSPKLTGIETVNLNPTHSGDVQLDLQDATGINTINISRVDATVIVDNLTSTQATLSVTNSSEIDNNVAFLYNDAAVNGASDTTTLTLSNAQIGVLAIEEIGSSNAPLTLSAGITVSPTEIMTVKIGDGDQGYETINLVSSGSANRIAGGIVAEDLATLTITGDQNLRIDGVGEAGSLTTVDASGMTGTASINYLVNAGVMSHTPDASSNGTVAFNFTGTVNNDTLRISDQVGDNDVLAGGAGTDELTMTQTATTAFFDDKSATATGFETLTIQRADDAIDAVAIAIANATTPAAIVTATATAITAGSVILRADVDKIDGDQTAIVLESLEANGNGFVTTYDVNNASTAEASVLTIKHSGNSAAVTGNNGLLENIIDLDTADSVSAGVTIAEGLNSEDRFNFTFMADSDGTNLNGINTVESVTINDSDTESNTVSLTEFARHSGTITVDGTTAGKFLNLDATANGYGYDTTGTTTGDALAVAKAITAGNAAGSDDAAVSTVFNTKAGGELLIATSVDAADYAGNLILRVGTANQNIELGTGDDTVIFADRTGITTATAGLTVDDTVVGNTGTDTVILDGTGVQTVGASEWTNFKGVDVIRLVGTTGSEFNLTVTDLLVDQTDAKDRITIINNDGVNNNAVTENTATIDLTPLSATNAVTFIGANDNNHVGAVGNVQTVIVNDVTANGNSTLNGGDADNVTEYTAIGINSATGTAFGTQAVADAAYNARANVTDGNNNIYQVNNTAEVTVGDLSKTTNFDTIAFRNNEASNQTLTLTLDGSTIDNLVDASHDANSTARETLTINATDNLSATHLLLGTSSLSIDADDGSVSDSFNLDILAARGNNNILTGAGDDNVTFIGNFGATDYAAGTTEAGVDISTLHTGLAIAGIDGILGNTDDAPLFAIGGSVAGGSTLAMGSGNDTVDVYGAISFTDFAPGAITGVDAAVFHSSVYMTAEQYASFGNISFVGSNNHELHIIDDANVTGDTIDLSKVTLSDTGSLNVTLETGVSSTGTGTDTSTGTITVGGVAATPTYSITGATTMNEDAANVTYTVTTTGVADGNIGYTLSGTNITTGDITGGSLTGTVAIAGGTGTFTVSAVADTTTEDDETLVVTLDDSATATVNTTIVDTSTTATGSVINVNANDPAVGTAAADTFTFSPTAQATDGTFNITGFDAANDKIVIDFVTVPTGTFNTLDDLAGQNNDALGPITIADNPFSLAAGGEVVAIFGNDSATSVPINLTIAGVGDNTTVVIEVI